MGRDGRLSNDEIDALIRSVVEIDVSVQRVIERSIHKSVDRMHEPHVVLVDSRFLKMREVVGPFADEHEALVAFEELTDLYAECIADGDVVLDIVVLRSE